MPDQPIPETFEQRAKEFVLALASTDPSVSVPEAGIYAIMTALDQGIVDPTGARAFLTRLLKITN